MSYGELTERERNVLLHLARYRLSFKEVLRHLYFEGADPQKTLDKLRSEGLIEIQKGFQGNRSSYRLARAGAEVLQVSPRRADALGSEALPTYLAIFSFCLLKGRPRLLLDKEEVSELFQGSSPSGRYHCLEHSKRRTCVYHAYVPGPTTKPSAVVNSTRAHVADVLDQAQWQRWVRYELYTHVILVDTEPRKNEIQRALHKAVDDHDRPLRESAPIRVECVPMYSNLEEALSGLA